MQRSGRWWSVLIGVLVVLAVAITAWVNWQSRTVEILVGISVDLPVIYGTAINPSDEHAAMMFLHETPTSRIVLDRLFVDADPARAAPDIAAAKRRGVQFFVLTHASSHAVEANHLFVDGNALGILVGATSTKLSGKDDYLLRIIPDYRDEQRAMAEFVADTAAGSRLLVIQDTSNLAYTAPAFEIFRDHLDTLADWEITRHHIDVASFNPVALQAVLRDDHDALYILAGAFMAPIGNIAQLFNRNHPDAPIYLTPWAHADAVYENAGDANQKLHLLSIYPPRAQDAAIDDFLLRFDAMHGYEPLGMSIGTRQALELFDSAFAAGHTTPTAVKRYLLTTAVHTTSLGDIRFDSSGDVRGDFNRVVPPMQPAEVP